MSFETDRAHAIQVPADLTRYEAAEALFCELTRALQGGAREVVLDCGVLEQASSSSVGVLWRAYQLCDEARVAIRLRAASDALRRTLTALDLQDHFGLEALGEPSAYSKSLVPDSGPRTYQDRFAPTERAIDLALTRFGSYLRRLHMPSEQEFELQTVFYEVATNIRLHAGVVATSEVSMSFVVGSDWLTLCFRDGGEPFDPTRQPLEVDFKKAARDRRTRGFGLPLLHRLTDRIVYVREEGATNVLTLEKKRRNK